VAKLKITLVKSAIGSTEKVMATVKALGLKKLNSYVIKEDLPQFRGMIVRVNHLVTVEEVSE
jgi:large subunit ribosomal protein L30